MRIRGMGWGIPAGIVSTMTASSAASGDTTKAATSFIREHGPKLALGVAVGIGSYLLLGRVTRRRRR